MNYKQTTQVPNIFFDMYLPLLNISELKVLLIIIRQTYGWVDQGTGKRKQRDRISHSQFMVKAHLSRRVISSTIQNLSFKGLIVISDFNGKVLISPKDRKGRSYLFYSFIAQPVQRQATTNATHAFEPVHKRVHNKTNYIKQTETKVLNDIQAIQAIIESIKQNIRRNIN